MLEIGDMLHTFTMLACWTELCAHDICMIFKPTNLMSKYKFQLQVCVYHGLNNAGS